MSDIEVVGYVFIKQQGEVHMRRIHLLLVVASLGCEGQRTVESSPGNRGAAKHDAGADGPVEAIGTEAAPQAVVVPPGQITSRTLLLFLPRTMAGTPASERRVHDEFLAESSYHPPGGSINVNLSFSRDLGYDRASVRAAASDRADLLAGGAVEARGLAVGHHRGVRLRYTTGTQVELSMFIGDRINVSLTRHGRATSDEELVALVREIDLDGLAALAPRAPAPPPAR